jgi:hypothetical protein
VSHQDAQQTLGANEVTLPKGHLFTRLTWVAAVIGVVGVVASLVLRAGHDEQFYFSWLVAYLYFLSIALGGLFFVMVLFVTRAGWGVVVRRVAENAMVTIPIFIVLFIPVFLGMGELFHWTHADAVEHDALLQSKTWYLNNGRFLGFAALYFLLWTGMALWFGRQSLRQDASGDHAITRRLQATAAPGLIVFALTVSFAAFDWMMSLDPHWYSTIFGIYYFSGCLVGVFAFMIVVFVVLRATGVLRNVVTVEHFHDLGKLLFAFTVFWSYIAFSQYFLIWYGNIPEETVWYMHRLEGSWGKASIALALGHFAIPFFFLMPQTIKRKTPLLLLGALWMLLMHYIDVYWVIMPVLHPHGVEFGILDVTTFVGIGGLFLAAFGWMMGRRALVPLRDPRLPESLGFENA